MVSLNRIAAGPLPASEPERELDRALGGRPEDLSGGARTPIDWSSTFEPRGVSTEQAVQMIEGIYRMFVERLKETLAS